MSSFIIDLSQTFEFRKNLFFEDLNQINSDYNDWFSGRKPFECEEKFPDAQDECFYHIVWIETPNLSNGEGTRFRIKDCQDRPNDIDNRITAAFNLRFNEFNIKRIEH